MWGSGQDDFLHLDYRGLPLLAFPDGRPEMIPHALRCLAGFSLRRRLHRRAILLSSRFLGPRKLLTRSRAGLPFDRSFPLVAFLAEVLPEGDSTLFPVVVFPSDLDRRRFYLSLLSADGVCRLFIKARAASRADEPWSGELEARAALGGVTEIPFVLPRIHRCGYSHGVHFLVMEALPRTARPLGIGARAVRWQFLAALSLGPRFESRIEQLPWWHDFLANSGEVPELRTELVERSCDRVEVSWAHGDFQRPNIYLDGETRWLVDWEDYTEFGPTLLDEVRFFLGDRARALAKQPRLVLRRTASHFGADRDERSRLQLALALAYLCSRVNGAGLLCGGEWLALGARGAR